MIDIKAPKQSLAKSAVSVYEFLNELENVESIMPDDLEQFEMTGDDSFLFRLKGMPRIYLKRGETEPPNKLILTSARENYDFHIGAFIEETGVDTCEVSLDFQGEFNMMLEMMIKSPITNLIYTMSEKLHAI